MSIRLNESSVHRYIAEVFAPEDALLQQVRSVGESLYAGMQVSASEGKLLHCLAVMMQAKRIWEFGAFVCYSTIWMARALPPDGEVITMERNPEHAAHARRHAQQSGLPITVLEGDAMQIGQTVAGPFDMIFLDGEKRCYMDYIDMALPKLRSGGLMIADNSLLFGAVLGEGEQRHSEEARKVMQAVNERLADSADFTGIMLPTPEGMSIGIKR